MIKNLISLFLVWLIIVLRIRFFTLIERKVLGYLQTRKGPNKVGIIGIFQPFRDAIKLFRKESVILKSSSNLLNACAIGIHRLLAIKEWYEFKTK